MGRPHKTEETFVVYLVSSSIMGAARNELRRRRGSRTAHLVLEYLMGRGGGKTTTAYDQTSGKDYAAARDALLSILSRHGILRTGIPAILALRVLEQDERDAGKVSFVGPSGNKRYGVPIEIAPHSGIVMEIDRLARVACRPAGSRSPSRAVRRVHLQRRPAVSAA